MRRFVIAAAVVCAALAVAVSPAAATNECKGLQVCVPVAGPWVVATQAGTEFQLDCPKRFIVGGLDAELSSRALDIGFVGGLGSPVNPGITTTASAVFLGRFLAAKGAATFRPHIGCVPASGGGQRTPTAYQVFKPGKPTTRVVKQLAVLPKISTRLVARCAAEQRLVHATYAVGVLQRRSAVGQDRAERSREAGRPGGAVHVIAQGGAGIPEHTIVQVDLVCAVAA